MTATPPPKWQFTMRTMFVGVVLFAIVLGVLTHVGRLAARMGEFFRLSRQTQEKIRSLKARPPSGVPPAQWDRAVDWTANLIAQVYFAPDKGDPDSLRHLNDTLDERMKREVDLTTLQWIWEECEKTPRSGAQCASQFRDVRLLTKEPITDDDLPHLWSLNKCWYLDLSNTQVTDQGLEHLEGLSNLEHLWLQNTQVTPEGVQKLQRALPACEIVY
jgi:hypothetical protein